MIAGIYRHYKGHHYLVLGLAHDANADDLYVGDEAHGVGGAGDPPRPLGEREVVVYVPLELHGAQTGARMAVRTLEDWQAVVCAHLMCPRYGEPVGPHPDPCVLGRHAVRRFVFVGERWNG